MEIRIDAYITVSAGKKSHPIGWCILLASSTFLGGYFSMGNCKPDTVPFSKSSEVSFSPGQDVEYAVVLGKHSIKRTERAKNPLCPMIRTRSWSIEISVPIR